MESDGRTIEEVIAATPEGSSQRKLLEEMLKEAVAAQARQKARAAGHECVYRSEANDCSYKKISVSDRVCGMCRNKSK